MRRVVFLAIAGCMVLVALVFCLRPAQSGAAETSALINDALDKQVERINFGDKGERFPEALKTIYEKTGVQFKVDPSVWDLLPWGQDTRIQAQLDRVTLRDAMKAITAKMGLRMTLRDEYVEIRPMPALRRLGQRASRTELHALDYLSSTPANLGTDRPTIKQLLDAVDEKLAADKETKEPLAIENRMADSPEMDKRIFVPRNATLADALEAIAKETRFTWYPWGKNVLVVPKEYRTQRLLNKRVTIPAGERGVDLLQLLTDLSTQTGVQFAYQPGAIQSVPATSRTIHGIFENAPGQEVLDAVVGATGLTYVIQDDKVVVQPAANAPAAAPPRDPIMGMIQLDNGMQVLVPTSQVPPDIREYLKYKTQKKFDEIRQMMKDEGFKPTTQPAPEEHQDL